jgi:hypothetical protein
MTTPESKEFRRRHRWRFCLCFTVAALVVSGFDACSYNFQYQGMCLFDPGSAVSAKVLYRAGPRQWSPSSRPLEVSVVRSRESNGFVFASANPNGFETYAELSDGGVVRDVPLRPNSNVSYRCTEVAAVAATNYFAAACVEQPGNVVFGVTESGGPGFEKPRIDAGVGVIRAFASEVIGSFLVSNGGVQKKTTLLPS